MTATLSAYASEQESLGFFRIFARPPGGAWREITLFRNAPVTMGSVSFADPFTEQTSQLTLPQVTVFDTPGSGDLDWLVPDCDIDIRFENTGDYDFEWSWEGYIASYSMSLNGTSSAFTVDLKGALFALDNYLATPGYPKRPIPYEILIAMAFDQTQHPCRLGHFQILWPEDWNLMVPEFKDPAYLSQLKPWGVATGKPWTGFTSRSTGSWEPYLTGHVNTMLVNMFASGGRQWTIRNRGLRRPELFLRKPPAFHDSRIIELQLGAPGITFDGTRDFTQRADVLYGIGQDEAGISYSGMQVSPDGRTTYFQPFAFSPATYPRGNSNPMYNKAVTPKEVQIKFEQGIDELSAIKVAQAQYERFVDPGITGTINLTTDLRYADGSLCPRLLIKAGSTLRIMGLLGIREGVLAHITSVTADFRAMTTQLSFDTKYRDALTVEEVRARTRDALTPNRMLQVNKFANTIQDLILPWSYKAGSGMIPQDASTFFLTKLKDTDVFPFEKQTIAYPPSNPSYRPWYVRIGPAHYDDPTKNWTQMAIPIRMGQAGGIRLTQIAAYDKDGHIMRVKFHASIYKGIGILPDNMPQFPHDPRGEPLPDPTHVPPITYDPQTPPLPYLKPRAKGLPNVDDKDRPVFPTTYAQIDNTVTPPVSGFEPNPFFAAAWQEKNNNGFDWPWASAANLPAKGADFVVGWGNYYEPAGYSPGRFSKGADRTGILEDTVSWTWSLNDGGYLNFTSNKNNALEPYAGMLFVMIYCDDQGDEPVYFMGRVILAEQGTS